MGRAPCCDKANVKKGPWSPEEDQKLRAYIEEHGTGGNWIALPTKIGLKRCGKSCRLRWLNYLRPNIRHGDFSEEEDQIICSLYISIGSRWSIIAAQLPGRTDNDIKNYWNTRLKKKLLGKGGDKPSQPRRLPVNGGSSEESSVDGDDPSSQTINSPALERMQLHMQLQGLYNPLSFYNGPALWPMLQYPLGDSISQGAQTDAIAAAAPQQPSDQDMLVDKHGMINPMLGFSSLRSTATSMENSSSNLSSFDYFGMQGELHDLLYGKNVSVGVQDYEKYMSEFDGNWLGADGFYGISSVGTWDSSSTLQPYAMSQDYVPGHDDV